MSAWIEFKETFKKELGKAYREVLRPGVAYALERMYGDVSDPQPQSYWYFEASELLDYLRDYTVSKRAPK